MPLIKVNDLLGNFPFHGPLAFSHFETLYYNCSLSEALPVNVPLTAKFI